MHRMPRARSKILVLGGGYVGLYVTWTLEKHTEVDLDITVVEPRAYMTYQPLLPEVAGGHVDARNVTVDLRQALLAREGRARIRHRPRLPAPRRHGADRSTARSSASSTTTS